MIFRRKHFAWGLTIALAMVVGGAFVARELTTTSAETTGTGGMELRVSGTGVLCDDANNPTKCTLLPAGSLTLSVAILPTTEGTVGWQSYVKFGGLTYNITDDPATEFKDPGAPPGQLGVRSPGNTADAIVHGDAYDLAAPFNSVSHYKGNLINLSMTCPASPGAHVVTLEPLDGVEAGGSGSNINPSNGTGGLATAIPASDSVTINCGAGVLPTATPTTEVATNTPAGPTDTPGPPTLTPTPGPDTPTPTNTSVPGTATVTRTPTTVPPTATRTATPEKLLGDVNDDGVVDSRDAFLVLQLDARIISSLENEASADVNEDGDINAIDALFILQIEAGLLDQP